MDLSNSEIRVLGCLLEKQRTTPDHYPLSLNSLRLACNQATNRDPVVDYDDAIVRDALHRLERRGYTRLAGASRAAKYRHLLSEALPMESSEQAVMCVLMLRGPQTPGELKQRGERIHAFAGLDEVHATLATLIERGLVQRLDRRPGQKEERYVQLLGEDAEQDTGVGVSAPVHAVGRSETSTSIPSSPGLSERVARLEQEVLELRAALAELGAGTGVSPDLSVEQESSEALVESGDTAPRETQDSEPAHGGPGHSNPSESDSAHGVERDRNGEVQPAPWAS